MENDGKIRNKVTVRRLVSPEKQRMISTAQKRLAAEMRQLLNKQITIQKISKFYLSYHMQTEDDYLKNDWFVNFTTGFYGALSDKSIEFLNSFYDEEGKRFLPLAGVACRINSSNAMASQVYAFLPLPIQTGLPAHVNGHFAIHSSRRSIWEHTSFGHWNMILCNHILAPSYCHFLLGLEKLLPTINDLKKLVKILPDVTSARDEFFASLVCRVYSYMIEAKLPVVPVPGKDNSLEFCSPLECLFTPPVRNESIEKLLLRLNQRICTSPDVGLRFKATQIDNIVFISPQVVLKKLRNTQLTQPISLEKSPFKDHEMLLAVLDFVLEASPAKDYTSLDGAPLCLTADGLLRHFSHKSPVFVDSAFSPLFPQHQHLFLSSVVSDRFPLPTKLQKTSPVRSLGLVDVATILPHAKRYMDNDWASYFWLFVKVGREFTVFYSSIAFQSTCKFYGFNLNTHV